MYKTRSLPGQPWAKLIQGLFCSGWTAARSGHLGASTSTGQTWDGHPDSAGGDADANAQVSQREAELWGWVGWETHPVLGHLQHQP